MKKNKSNSRYPPITRSGVGWEVGGAWFSCIELAKFAQTRPESLELSLENQRRKKHEE